VASVLAQRDEKAKQDEADRIKREEDEKADKLKGEEAANVRRAEITEAVTAATAPLVEKITKLEGTTILRGDGGEQLPVKKEVKRGTGDLFKGVFGIQRAADRAPDPEDGAETGAEQ
jgi:predicted patatin/cPLA2 family phospholipase